MLRRKRIFDVCVALFVLVLGAPLFLLTFLAVKLTSRGPALYAAERVGQGGRRFRFYKFRTMIDGADNELRVVLLASPELAAEFARDFKLRRDPRITAVGSVLRRMSLDELPQFWNVLRGDMSVVGWRPIIVDEIDRYGDSFPFVSSLRPGITGLWQVSGRNNISYSERVQLDALYARDPRLRTDVVIVVRTFVQMFRWSRNGAY